MIRDVHPGSGSWFFYPSRIRIHNTECNLSVLLLFFLLSMKFFFNDSDTKGLVSATVRYFHAIHSQQNVLNFNFAWNFSNNIPCPVCNAVISTMILSAFNDPERYGSYCGFSCELKLLSGWVSVLMIPVQKKNLLQVFSSQNFVNF